MFVALVKDETHESIFERFKDFFREPLVKKTKAEVPNALPFYTIEAKSYRGECPWEAVEEAAGALRARVLFPPDTLPPKESALLPFKANVFFERLLFNTAADAIEKMQLDPCRVGITVFDENAFLVDLIEKLVPLAFHIKVITNCVTAYEKLSDYLLEQFGISIVVCARADDSILSSTFIISGNATAVPLIFPGILFTNGRNKLMNAVVINGEGFDLPEKYAPLLPKGIKPLSFAGALYELCGADDLGKTKYKNTVAL